MKKIYSLLLVVTILLSLCACSSSKLSPAEKLEDYITKNGTESDGAYALVCPEAETIIENNDGTIASMKSLKGTTKTEFKIVKNESGVTLELVDSSNSSVGLKMERRISISLDGIFTYRNSLTANGSEFGVSLEGEIPVETYNKENDPVITKTEFSAGAQLTDEVKAGLKNYINLALDCFANELSKEELSLTLSDFGYTSYPVAVEE